MADVYVSTLPDGTVGTTSWVMCEDAAGTTTFRVAVSAIVALVTNASQLTAGTVAFARLPVGTSGSTVCVGNDSRLSDSRAPLSHKGTHFTGQSDAILPADIGAAAAVHNHVLASVTDAGTAASRNVAASGNAAASQVVTGDDTRLTNARAPTSHATSHQLNGGDPILPRVLATTLTSSNNLDVTGYDIVRVTSSGNITITGIVATAPVLIVNENASGGGTITLAHESASSTATNRVRSQTGGDIVLQPDGGQVWLSNSSVASRWRA